MIIKSIDFETTGFPPNAAVCEVGWTPIEVLDGRTRIGQPVSMLVNPGRPIEAKASNVHGIIDADVANAPSVDVGFREMVAGADVFCAHNAQFERNFFGTSETKIICTYKVASVLFPDAPSHKNSSLAEQFADQLDIDPALAQPLHRAAPDSYITAHLLSHFLKFMTIEEMLKVSSEERQIKRMPFGKHKGMEFSALPVSYLQWGVGSLNAPEIVSAMKRELKRRG